MTMLKTMGGSNQKAVSQTDRIVWEGLHKNQLIQLLFFFIRHTGDFPHSVENLNHCCPGRIIEPCWVADPEARAWYEREARQQTWSVRTLQRNISSQYYYRILKTQQKQLPATCENPAQAKLEFIKNPVVVEFLGLTADSSFNETKLEQSIITNLQKF